MLCLTPDVNCGDYIAKDALDIVKSIGDIAMDAVSFGGAEAIKGITGIGGAVGDIGSNVKDFNFPPCDWEASTIALL